MNNEYKRLKEELDGADLDSILPGFDREASWKELSPRLKKTQSKTYLWRYAAALVAIIITAVIVRMQMNKESTEDQIATTNAPATTPVVIDTKVVPAPPKQEPVAAPKPALIVNKTTAPKVIPTQENVQPELQPAPVEEILIATEPELIRIDAEEKTEQPVATVKPLVKRPKAIHLLDIDNENRQAVIQNQKELQGGLPQRIVNLIPGRQYSNTDNDRKPSSLFRAN